MQGQPGGLRLAAVASLTLLGTLAAPAGASELDEYRPLLRYDSAESHHAQRVARGGEAIEGDVVYGHRASEGEDVWLQYWLFYPYNEQDRGIVRTGRHEGDWEFVQFRLGEDGAPDAATFAQHSWAEGCSFEELEVADDGEPIVYVANGSHASYPRPGTVDRPWPDPNDEADGEGRQVRPEVVTIGEQAPPWVRDPSPWGDSRAGFVPGEESSPRGPMFTGDGRWARPSTYHEEVARACGAGPPGRPWLTAGLLALGALALGSLALLWRRYSDGRNVAE